MSIIEAETNQRNNPMDSLAEMLLRLCRAEERIPQLFTQIQLKLLILEGPSTHKDAGRVYIRKMVSYSLYAILLAVAAGAVTLDLTLFIASSSLAAFVPFSIIRSLDQRIRKKKRSIIIQLPEFLNKLVLLINAGETVQQALVKCVQGKVTIGNEDGGGQDSQSQADQDNPLYKELSLLANDMGNNISFPIALENFSKRCGVQEISLFTNTVLLNYRRGGEDFVVSLRELNRGLWEKRKSLARTLGEEASSKLVFPMVLIFLVVTVIVAAPAILMMSQY